MTQFYLVPRWFFGFDIALEILFGAIALLVALYSFRMYKLSAQRECRILGLGFLSMSLGYFTWSLLNLYITSQLNVPQLDVPLRQLFSLSALAVVAYVCFLVTGAATLSYITLPGRSDRSYVALVSLSLLVVIFAANKALAFYFVSSFLLCLVTIHYFKSYLRHRHRGTLLLFFAFLFIFAGNVAFTFAALHSLSYVAGHILQLIGYLLALLSLILMVRS